MRKYLISSCLLIMVSLLMSSELYAGRISALKERMRNVSKIAFLPVNYEISFEDDKQEEANRGKVDKTVELRASQFQEKLKKYTEKRKYQFIYHENNKQAIIGIINILKSKNQDLFKALGDKINSKSKEEIIIKEIAPYVQEIGLDKDSDVFMVILCSEKIGTVLADIKRNLPIGSMIGWEYYPSAEAFLIDSDTLELIDILGAGQRDSLYDNEYVVNALSYDLIMQLPRNKNK